MEVDKMIRVEVQVLRGKALHHKTFDIMLNLVLGVGTSAEQTDPAM